MSARVLDVGNCDADHARIRGLLTDHFDVSIDRVMHVAEAQVALSLHPFDLVLVNRLIFANDSPGLPLIQWMRSQPRTAATPVMLISNFADAQEQAVAAGAQPGFGKARLRDPQTVELLAAHLPRRRAVAGGS